MKNINTSRDPKLMRLNNAPKKEKNLKKIITQRKMTTIKDGSKINHVDIFSAIKQNNNSRFFRHISVEKDNKPKKKSSVLVRKLNGKIQVLESKHDGKKEKQRVYNLKNPKSIKQVFNKQSSLTKGEPIRAPTSSQKVNKEIARENENYFNKRNKTKKNNRKDIVSYLKNSVSKLFDKDKKTKKQLQKERKKRKKNEMRKARLEHEQEQEQEQEEQEQEQQPKNNLEKVRRNKKRKKKYGKKFPKPR